MPIGLDHFHHHVILEILDAVEHPLAEDEGGHVRLRGGHRECLAHFVGQPHSVHTKERLLRKEKLE